jgi:hypothetical protein
VNAEDLNLVRCQTLTLAWDPPPSAGATLFVVFAYHGADRDRPSHGWRAWIESEAVRAHRAIHRDHYANPRPIEYELAMVAAASRVLTPNAQPDVVIDDRFVALPPDMAERFSRVERAPVASADAWRRRGCLADVPRYDNVVLVYPDALGLGCQAGESAARRGARHLFVLNGRRRAFRLDAAMAARLRRSRLLAQSRIVERLLGLAVVPVGAMLATLDRLRADTRG